MFNYRMFMLILLFVNFIICRCKEFLKKKIRQGYFPGHFGPGTADTNSFLKFVVLTSHIMPRLIC
jgi:hypothetical protein